MKSTRKREQLITAAKTLFYERGMENTTLAQTAHAARPLRQGLLSLDTKDALVGAVVASHGRDILEQLGRFNAERGLKARLRAFPHNSLSDMDTRARCGCPCATLDAELKKSSSRAARSSGSLLRLYHNWLERQFQGFVRVDTTELAKEYLAAVQGSYILALTLNGPGVSERAIARLERQIDALRPPSPGWPARTRVEVPSSADILKASLR